MVVREPSLNEFVGHVQNEVAAAHAYPSDVRRDVAHPKKNADRRDCDDQHQRPQAELEAAAFGLGCVVHAIDGRGSATENLARSTRLNATALATVAGPPWRLRQSPRPSPPCKRKIAQLAA